LGRSYVEVSTMFKHLSPFALATALMIGGAAGAIAQTEPTPPPLPQADTQQPTAPGPTANTTANMAASAQANFPALPPGHDDVREVQSQLIALGFDPGPADGEPGPATVTAAQQYNENRGGSGPVPIDGALLTRLKQDTAPRLTPEQVAARSQPRYRATAPATSSFEGAIQNFGASIRSILPNGGN
jgi:peptidoglycan hydrolase-like protein with peptidoglycan-binding domain